jgi:hypothetical protein
MTLERNAPAHTARSGASLPGQSGVVLRDVGPGQLTESNREESGEDEETRWRHDRRILDVNN